MFSLLILPKKLDLLYTISNLKLPTLLFLTTLPRLLDFSIEPTSYICLNILWETVLQRK